MRNIPREVWVEPYFSELDHTGRYLVLYLWAHRDVAGLVWMTPAQIAAGCGCTEEEADDVLGGLAADRRILMGRGIVWIIDSALYPEGRKGFWTSAICTVLGRVREPAVRNAWLEHHTTIYPEVVDQVSRLSEEPGREPLIPQAATWFTLDDPRIEADVAAVWREYERLHRPARLTQYRRRKILERLTDRYTNTETGEIRVASVEDLCAALRGYRKDRGVSTQPETQVFMTREQCEGWVRLGLDVVPPLMIVKPPVAAPAKRRAPKRALFNGRDDYPWPSVEALVQLWNDTRPAELPAVAMLTDDRRTAAAIALDEFPERSFWEAAIAELAHSRFLRGLEASKEHPNWKADFDWLFGRNKQGVSNLARLVEGRYRDTQGAEGRSRMLKDLAEFAAGGHA